LVLPNKPIEFRRKQCFGGGRIFTVIVTHTSTNFSLLECSYVLNREILTWMCNYNGKSPSGNVLFEAKEKWILSDNLNKLQTLILVLRMNLLVLKQDISLDIEDSHVGASGSVEFFRLQSNYNAIVRCRQEFEAREASRRF